ncbi:MAG: serine dehydratase subunit alpha family protein, partial [Clostridia bacterium]|nr:serine dehydratase subunit alpha family protein [Clostridia bacterium]
MLCKEKYDTYVKLLKEELVPAMGCTEPISIAYAVAKTKSLLGEKPISGILEVSANIVKNAK